MLTKLLKTVLILSLLLKLIQNRWSQQQANQWYKKQKWGAGVNYTPAYAVNQIQFWENYNKSQIIKQVQWARQIGFTKMRVFLHLQPYIDNSKLFLSNIRNFLQIVQQNNIQIIFVLFDDCWHKNFHGGKQPQPIPGVHNSQWVQCPGDYKKDYTLFKMYTQDIITNFKNDQRVIMWDLYNQVGNSQHFQFSLPLLKMIFQWARQINPIQPLTSCHWNSGIQFKLINDFTFQQSDVITFHAYCDANCTQQHINSMKKHNRPVICTQYMARQLHSKFITHLPIFKQNNVLAISWGLVFGRTQTYYPWWSVKGEPVPKIWFHDVLHPDGSSFDKNETDFIKSITN